MAYIIVFVRKVDFVRLRLDEALALLEAAVARGKNQVVARLIDKHRRSAREATASRVTARECSL
jgi:hypothetical protein